MARYAEMVYYTDFEKMEIGRREIDASPVSFKMGGVGYWKNLIAEEDTEIRRNTVTIVKVKSFHLPPNTLASPLSIMRHPLGSVIDVYSNRPARIEEGKRVVAAAFLAAEDGIVERGDLVGVVKVFPVSISPTLRLPSPQVAMSLETSRAKIAYRSNGKVVREETEISEYWYRRWNIGEWYPLIARKDVEVEKGRVEFVDVHDIELPPNTIPVPLYMMRHALGTVVDVYQPGRHRMVEEMRLITKALFMPVFSGKIREGDIVGVMNVYYVSTGEVAHKVLQNIVAPRAKGRIVYWKRKDVMDDKEVEIEPFMFKRSSIGRFEPLVASRTCEMRANEVEVVDIEPIEVPAGAIVQPLSGRNHAYGILLDVFDLSPVRMVEEDKRITRAVFLPFRDCKVEKGGIIGALTMYHISPLIEAKLFAAKHKIVV